ncbi:MAG: MFS transporter [Pseudomonadota bacterium]
MTTAAGKAPTSPRGDATAPAPASPWHHGRLMRFCAAVGFANLGDGIALAAWAWTASLLTRDPLWIAVLPAALRIPWVLFALPSGILADRVDRRHLIVGCDLLRTAAYAIAGVAIFLHLPLSEPAGEGVGPSMLYPILLSIALLIGCAEVTRDNAAQSMLPALVPTGKLERANGLLGSIEIVGNGMAGPAFGAFLVALFLPAPFLVIAVALLLAALLTASLSGQFRPATGQAPTAGWRAELAAGFRFVAGHPTLRLLVVVTGVWCFLEEMAMIAIVLHLQENLGVGAATYGLILAASAVGGIIGGLLIAPLLSVIPRGRLAQWIGFATPPAILVIAFAPGPITVAVAMFLDAMSGVIWNTLSIAYRQRIVPDEIRGRVNSVYRLFAWGMMPLGLVASGALVSVAETFLPRGDALIAPFLVAATGLFVLVALTRRAVGRAFR